MTTDLADAGVRARAVAWLWAVGVTALAALLRFPGLARPGELVFDETYYVKDAWTLLHLGFEGDWPEEPDADFEAGRVDGYLTTPSYVVHPPVGKWVVALGLALRGAQDPAGWRLGTAIAGTIAVLLLTRIARRLFRSTALGVVAGLLLAVDGSAIVHSRVALLDGILMLFVLAGFGALLVDRDLTARRLLRTTGPPWAATTWGPGLGLRPWRLLGGVMLGLAVGTKWSALTFVAVLGLLSVGWDAAARHRAGVARWWQATLLRDAPTAFLSIVGVGALTYVAGWSGWLRSSDGYGRRWALDHPGEGATWLPESLRSLWHYHQEMWGFHTSLTAEHPYASHPSGWTMQLRPTSFFYVTPEPAQQMCGADRCSQAITSLGNPLIWWLGTLAVIACVWWVASRSDGVALASLSGLVAGWAPWFAYSHRTIFTFYAIVFLPWLILCLTYATGRLVRWGRGSPVPVVVGVLLALVLAVSAYFYPLWTAQVTTFDFWQQHQWLRSWI